MATNLKTTQLTEITTPSSSDVLPIVDVASDVTKKIQYSNAVPVTLINTATLTNKTLTAPIIATISNTGLLTLPTTTDTLVGRATTDTLTNKTLTAAKIVDGGFIADANGNEQIIFSSAASAVNEVTVTNAATGNAPSIAATGGDTNIDIKITPKGTGKITTGSSNTDLILDGNGTGLVREDARYGIITADSDGATITFDMSVSNLHSVTLGGNRTLAVSNVKTGQAFMLRLLQDATGSRTVTWFSTISWAGGSAPTLTTTASKADTFGFICTGSGTYDGFVVGQAI